TRLTAGEPLMAEEMFDGFDHRQYEEEVTARWGAEAYRRWDEWWTGLSDQQRRDFRAEAVGLQPGWLATAADGERPDSPRWRALGRRHIDWLSRTPGPPAADPDGDLRGSVTGLAEMYVSDERFSRNFGGSDVAKLVRDSLLAQLAATCG